VSEPHFDARFRAQLDELFTWRRDVRHFRSEALPDDALARLVATAQHSPSVGLSQPWRFVRVRDAARRAAVIASFERANADALAQYEGSDAALYARLKLAGLRDAPEHLAVCCDERTQSGKGLGRRTMPEMLAYSTVTAIYTFWLAARAEGIGAGWVSILEPEVVLHALSLPESWRLVAYLCVGYPEDESASPELLRLGWERHDAASATIVER